MTDYAELIERLLDPKPPHHGKCLQAATAIRALIAERDKLKLAIKTQANAVLSLQANEQTEINMLRAERNKWHQAITTLDSEREANATLTNEVEQLTAQLAAAHQSNDTALAMAMQAGADAERDRSLKP